MLMQRSVTIQLKPIKTSKMNTYVSVAVFVP